MLVSIGRAADAILPNPIEVPEPPRSPQPRSTADVLFSGTLTAKKGVVSLIDAWPTVRRRCPTAHLHLFGKDGRASNCGSMQSALEARLPADARRSVTFHGHTAREKLLGELAHARVAVFPSYAEACAMGPLEAMAARCPTISSSRGSGPELLQHERDGLLVDPASPADIAAAITRVLTDDGLAARLGDAGRLHVARSFSLTGLLPRNIALYRRCVEEFAAGARASAMVPRPAA
jgi:glycosyltransferase involved in cell wall biosynthesis